MCAGAKYTETSGREWKIYFPNPKAALPIVNTDGSVDWVKWGRRKEEKSPYGLGKTLLSLANGNATTLSLCS